MREQRRFGERKQPSVLKDPRKKYFILCEGEKTEYIYIEELRKQTDKVGINAKIEICPVVKGYSQKSWSSPQKLTECIRREVQDAANGKIRYATLLNNIVDSIEMRTLETHHISQDEIYHVLKELCIGFHVENLEETYVEAPLETAENLLESLSATFDRQIKFTESAKRISDPKTLHYVKGYDLIILIFDRDRQNRMIKRGELC